MAELALEYLQSKSKNPPPDLASIPKSLATNPANKVSDVSRSTKGDADVLTGPHPRAGERCTLLRAKRNSPPGIYPESPQGP